MKLFKKTLIFLLFLSGTFPSPAQNNWIFKKEKDGIRIYTRQSKLSKFYDLKVELDLTGSIAQLFSILMDVQKYPEWFYATKTGVLIKRISNHEIIYHSEIETPWPLSNRDYYGDLNILVDSPGNALTANCTGIKDYLPEKKDLVRIPRSNTFWSATATSDKIMHLVFLIELDPGGSVPAWIYNLFATRGPLETFKNLKEKMRILNQHAP